MDGRVLVALGLAGLTALAGATSAQRAGSGIRTDLPKQRWQDDPRMPSMDLKRWKTGSGRKKFDPQSLQEDISFTTSVGRYQIVPVWSLQNSVMSEGKRRKPDGYRATFSTRDAQGGGCIYAVTLKGDYDSSSMPIDTLPTLEKALELLQTAAGWWVFGEDLRQGSPIRTGLPKGEPDLFPPSDARKWTLYPRSFLDSKGLLRGTMTFENRLGVWAIDESSSRDGRYFLGLYPRSEEVRVKRYLNTSGQFKHTDKKDELLFDGLDAAMRTAQVAMRRMLREGSGIRTGLQRPELPPQTIAAWRPVGGTSVRPRSMSGVIESQGWWGTWQIVASNEGGYIARLYVDEDPNYFGVRGWIDDPFVRDDTNNFATPQEAIAALRPATLKLARAAGKLPRGSRIRTDLAKKDYPPTDVKDWMSTDSKRVTQVTSSGWWGLWSIFEYGTAEGTTRFQATLEPTVFHALAVRTDRDISFRFDPTQGLVRETWVPRSYLKNDQTFVTMASAVTAIARYYQQGATPARTS